MGYVRLFVGYDGRPVSAAGRPDGKVADERSSGQIRTG